MSITCRLSDMSLEELWHLFPIRLTAHQGCWAEWFEEEKAALSELVPQAAIHHIGSTAVAGIWAKPIVDILMILPDSESLKHAKGCLLEVGWLLMSESAERISLNKGYTENGFAEKVFHLHLRLPGDEDELLFCDYLRNHTDEAQAYERLKKSLWKEFEYDRDGYTQAKSSFVAAVMARARAGSRRAPGGPGEP